MIQKKWRLRLIVILLISTILSIGIQAQSISLPSWVADSLIYETRYSRQCRHTVDTLQNEIKSLGSELLQVNARLDLSKKEVKTLSGLLENSKQYAEVMKMQYGLDIDKLKRKIKKLWVWIIGEGGAIVIVILLL